MEIIISQWGLYDIVWWSSMLYILLVECSVVGFVCWDYVASIMISHLIWGSLKLDSWQQMYFMGITDRLCGAGCVDVDGGTPNAAQTLLGNALGTMWKAGDPQYLTQCITHPIHCTISLTLEWLFLMLSYHTLLSAYFWLYIQWSLLVDFGPYSVTGLNLDRAGYSTISPAS